MKLMIVDDDYQIRVGMCKAIGGWEFDIDKVYTCSDGIEAWKSYKKEHPDLILADIEMPGCTGLEFLEKVRKNDPDTKIIFLTAYANFEYCQTALKLGADDFILKPVKVKDLKVIIKKYIRKIEEQKNEDEAYKIARLEKLMNDMYQFRKENVSKEFIRVLREQYPFLTGAFFITMLIKFENGKIPDGQDFEEKWKLLSDQLQKECNCVILPGQSDLYICIGKACNSTIYNLDHSNRLKNVILKWNEKYHRQGYSVAAGISAAHKADRLYDGYRQAAEVLDKNFYHENCVGIYQFEQHKSNGTASFREVKEQLIKTPGTAPYAIIRDVLYRLPEIGEKNGMTQEEFRRECIEIYSNLAYTAKIPETDQAVSEQILQCSNAKKCIEILDRHIEKNIWEGYRRIYYRKGNERHSAQMEQALEYISQHFQEQISIREVAAVLGKNPNYFSSIFKKEMGMPFVEYIACLRVEKARRMLLDTNKKVQDICKEVGYMDYPYFSKQFRKITGYSASDIRNHKNEKNI